MRSVNLVDDARVCIMSDSGPTVRCCCLALTEVLRGTTLALGEAVLVSSDEVMAARASKMFGSLESKLQESDDVESSSEGSEVVISSEWSTALLFLLNCDSFGNKAVGVWSSSG
jgi:hypothetical protein